jgi:hypothetical protein
VAAAHPVLTILALASNPTDDKDALEALTVALKSLDASASSLSLTMCSRFCPRPP